MRPAADLNRPYGPRRTINAQSRGETQGAECWPCWPETPGRQFSPQSPSQQTQIQANQALFRASLELLDQEGTTIDIAEVTPEQIRATS